MKTELSTQLGNLFDEVSLAIGSLTEEQMNSVPFEGSWTAAQVVDHLIKSYAVIDALKVPGTPAERPSDQKVETLKTMFLNMEVKYNSPKEILPSTNPINKEALINELARRTKNIIDFSETENLSLACTIAPFPGLGVLTRLEWISFLSFHTERHFRQLKKISNIVTNKK